MTTKPISGPLTAVSLEVENVKRVKAVAVTFEGNGVVQITGENQQGKTSVLDAFWWAIEGTRHVQAEPIRKGTDKATTRVVLRGPDGDLIVTRRMTAKNPQGTLTVEAGDGARYDTPQAILDSLLGLLTFDPLSFMSLKPVEQFTMLARFVPDLDLEKFDADQKADFDRRTEVGRDLKRTQGVLSSLAVPTDTPDEPVSEDELVDQIEQAVQRNAAIGLRAMRLDNGHQRLNDIASRRVDLERQMKALKAEQDDANAAYDEAHAQVSAWMAEAAPAAVDVEVLRAQHREVRAKNAAVAKLAERRDLEKAASAIEINIENLTTRMEAREADKRRAIAEADMPVAGIKFGDKEVRLNGEPFDQASDAEQLRTCLAISMALNPKLRVLRVRQADTLDAKSMKIVEEMARERGYLIIMERVQASPGIGMIVEIVDGQNATPPPGKRK